MRAVVQLSSLNVPGSHARHLVHVPVCTGVGGNRHADCCLHVLPLLWSRASRCAASGPQYPPRPPFTPKAQHGRGPAPPPPPLLQVPYFLLQIAQMLIGPTCKGNVSGRPLATGMSIQEVASLFCSFSPCKLSCSTQARPDSGLVETTLDGPLENISQMSEDACL